MNKKDIREGDEDNLALEDDMPRRSKSKKNLNLPKSLLKRMYK